MPDPSPITEALFAFLEDLALHNDKAWFDENRERYIRDLRDPLVKLVSEFGPRLAKISPHFVADPRPVGGSIFRIHRDTRFSHDKRPYKENAGVQFRHEAGKDAHAPCFYLHLQPGEVFAAAGIWHPDGPAQRTLRTAIAENPDAWLRIVGAPAFRKTFTQGGESLKRPPQGIRPDHPCIEDLKRKDFVVVTSLDKDQVCAPGFLDALAALFKQSRAYVAFLCKAMDLPC